MANLRDMERRIKAIEEHLGLNEQNPAVSPDDTNYEETPDAYYGETGSSVLSKKALRKK